MYATGFMVLKILSGLHCNVYKRYYPIKSTGVGCHKQPISLYYQC